MLIILVVRDRERDVTQPHLFARPGDPHIGHAYEAITSDVLSRFQRMAGKRVFFQTGSDEHGQKIANRAAALGLRPIDICDKYAGKCFSHHLFP